MTPFTNPTHYADEGRQAMRELAQTTREIEDPRELYPVIGSITESLTAIAQALHQLGAFHDGPAHKHAWISDDTRDARAASAQASWELHRAAEMLHQVADGVDRAREVEATITYRPSPVQEPPPVRTLTPTPGLTL